MSAIRELERASDSRGLGRAQINLAAIHGIACNSRAQERAAELAIAHYANAGFSPAVCYASLASALYHGPVPVATALARCAALLESVNDRMTEANLAVVLGGLHGLRGDFAEARRLLDHARSVFADLGQRAAVDTILDPHAVALERWAGNIEEAARICQDNFERLSAADNRAYASTRAVQLADLLLDLGDADRAEQYIRFADERAIRSDVLVQFLRRAQRARLLARTGRHEDAESLAREAVAIASLTDVLLDRARTHAALAEVLTASGANREAKRETAEAARLLTKKGLNAKESPAGSLSHL